MEFNCKNERGFTLIELVVVFAVIALVMAAVSATISKGRQSGVQEKTMADLRNIETGLFQYKTYKGSLPLQATMGTFPTALSSDAYIDSTLRAAYRYLCNNTDNKAVIRVPALSTSGEASSVSTVLVDSGLCASATVNTDKTIDCALASLNGSANCK